MTEQEMKSLIERLKSELVPIGSIMCCATPKCPESYLPCDGRELMQSQYPDLFKVIGKTFGGSSKTFCLPDLQGKFIRGWDEEGDTDPDASERSFGDSQNDAIQGHGHKASGELSYSGGHRHKTYHDDTSFKAGTNTFSSDNSFSKYTPYGEDGYNENKSKSYYSFRIAETETCGSHTHSINKLNVTDVENGLFGIVKVATETRPKNIALLYCIKVK